jgi:hypothetical protein
MGLHLGADENRKGNKMTGGLVPTVTWKVYPKHVAVVIVKSYSTAMVSGKFVSFDYFSTPELKFIFHITYHNDKLSHLHIHAASEAVAQQVFPDQGMTGFYPCLGAFGPWIGTATQCWLKHKNVLARMSPKILDQIREELCQLAQVFDKD